MKICNPSNPGRYRRYLVPVLLASIPGWSLAQENTNEDEDVFVLNPFEVSVSENDVGYYASSTLAGTRMNSQLKDLAASISVVTAQQLEDTGAVDINDVFLYEASTEGTHTYTSYSTDRYGAVTDNVQTAPSSANRMRGLGSVDIARNYFVGIRDIPIDSYNVESLTIQRGPNSVLFGLGSPSGLVNSTPARATIGSNKGRTELRIGRWDELRTSFSLNRTLIEDTLAINLALLYQDKGIQLQPAFDKTKRQYGTITYKPFSTTTIRASYEHYSNEAQRAGSVTAIDLITPWINAGRPSWNPNTLTATYEDGHSVTINNKLDFNSWSRDPELYKTLMPGLAPVGSLTNAFTFVDRGEILNRSQNQLGSRRDMKLDSGKLKYYFSGITGPNQPERLFASDGPYEQKTGEFPGYIQPGVHDKSIYDYEKINLAAANFYDSDADIYDISLEQQILDNLFLEVAYHNEHFEQSYINDIRSGSTKLYIDVNSHNLDGSVNPNYGRPYMDAGYEPRYSMRDDDEDTMRATLAWQVDFTKKDDSLLSYLGRHNIMGLAQYNETDHQNIAFSPRVITHSTTWMDKEKDGTYKDYSSQPNPVKYRSVRYYVGDNNSNVLYGSGRSIQDGYFPDWGDFTGPVMPSAPLYHYVWDISNKRDGATDYPVEAGRPQGEWVSETADYAYVLTDNASREQQRLTSYATALQSYFWNDRIVTTLGWRYDKQKSRRAIKPDRGVLNMTEPNGYSLDDPNWGGRNAYMILDNLEETWDVADGTTTTMGIVVHPFADWKWAPEWLGTVSFFYNKSDSFQPTALEYNLYGEVLPEPTGEGEDYGISFSLFDGKLHAKINHYEQTATNARHGGDTRTMTQRLQRMEWESNWGVMDFWEWNIELRDGLELGSLDFFDTDNVETQPYVDELYELARYAVEPVPLRDTTRRFNDIRNVESSGTEVTLDFNPTPNFNIKLAATHQESMITGAAPATAAWAAQRYTIWPTMNNYDELAEAHGFNAINPDTGKRIIPAVDWWNGINPYNGEEARYDPDYAFEAGDPGVDPRYPERDIRWPAAATGPGITNYWIANGLNLLKELNGKPTPQYPEWRGSLLATYRFTEGKLKGFMIGGSARWEDKKVVGWAGELINGEMKTDINRPFYQDEHYSFDMWTSYRFLLTEDIRMSVQLNVRDIFENGGIEPIRYNPNGDASTYRIVSPRRWSISTKLDF